MSTHTAYHLSMNKTIGGKGMKSQMSLLRDLLMQLHSGFFNLCTSQESVCEDRSPETGTFGEQKKKKQKYNGMGC